MNKNTSQVCIEKYHLVGKYIPDLLVFAPAGLTPKAQPKANN